MYTNYYLQICYEYPYEFPIYFVADFHSVYSSLFPVL